MSYYSSHKDGLTGIFMEKFILLIFKFIRAIKFKYVSKCYFGNTIMEITNKNYQVLNLN